MKTPSGDIFFEVDKDKLTSISWGKTPKSQSFLPIEQEMESYFKGELKSFKTPFKFVKGTYFQQKVWHALCEIPYGTTVTYSDLAKKLGSHARAIGGAVGKNPLPIIIPCHRVMGKSGKLTGFSGGEGVKTKQILLELEKAPY
jgi:methylated-DNA-[protein]-cysteine S-methyltransferase